MDVASLRKLSTKGLLQAEFHDPTITSRANFQGTSECVRRQKTEAMSFAGLGSEDDC